MLTAQAPGIAEIAKRSQSLRPLALTVANLSMCWICGTIAYLFFAAFLCS